MFVIELPDKQFKQRNSAIRNFLRVLLSENEIAKKGENTTVACSSIPQGRNFILGTFDGSAPNDPSYREWRFTSYNSGFRCMYFEEWIPANLARNRWVLNNISFSLFRVLKEVRKEAEVLAVHCEPRESEPKDKEERSHHLYKRIPHLHVSLASQPLPHAHFALHHIKEMTMMNDAESLTSFMRSVLLMIKDEVINTKDKDWKSINQSEPA